MIKCGKLKGKEDEEAVEQCILYTKDGSKALGYFPYSKHGGEEGAKAAAEKREKQVQFFKQKHQGLLDAIDAFGAPVVLKYLLDKAADCEACQEVVKSYVEAQGDEVEKQYKPPPGWNDPRSWLSSKTGAEAIRKKAWASMGGKQHLCAQHMEGKVDDPDRFCAALKDKVEGTTHWRKGRGGGKSEKSFTELTEEALTMLQKDEHDIDLSELEAWLAGDAGESGSDASPPASDAEPEPVTELAPAPVEELPNDFHTFLLRDHAQRKAGVLALLGEEVTDNG